MKTVFFESLRYKFITKNDFYYGSCPDIHIRLQFPKGKSVAAIVHQQML